MTYCGRCQGRRTLQLFTTWMVMQAVRLNRNREQDNGKKMARFQSILLDDDMNKIIKRY